MRELDRARQLAIFKITKGIFIRSIAHDMHGSALSFGSVPWLAAGSRAAAQVVE